MLDYKNLIYKIHVKFSLDGRAEATNIAITKYYQLEHTDKAFIEFSINSGYILIHYNRFSMLPEDHLIHRVYYGCDFIKIIDNFILTDSLTKFLAE